MGKDRATSHPVGDKEKEGLEGEEVSAIMGFEG